MDTPDTSQLASRNAKTGPSLKGRALRLLAARDYGRAELERKLSAYAESAESMRVLLDELQAKGFINDARAAASVLHRRAEKLGAARVLGELRQKGFTPELIAAQADILRESEEIRIKTVWQKKFTSAPSNPADKAKQMRFLASRGFAPSLISKLMRALASEDTSAENSLGEFEP